MRTIHKLLKAGDFSVRSCIHRKRAACKLLLTFWLNTLVPIGGEGLRGQYFIPYNHSIRHDYEPWTDHIRSCSWVNGSGHLVVANKWLRQQSKTNFLYLVLAWKRHALQVDSTWIGLLQLQFSLIPQLCMILILTFVTYKSHYSYVWPFALKAQTTQQQIHEYCSLCSKNNMNVWLTNTFIMWILQTDGTNLQ